MNPFCIYHGGCDDGFGAAWAVRNALGVNVDFYAGTYQGDPPEVAGRDVIMVDFSYKRPVIDRMAGSARSVLILDHHKTAQEDLADYGLPWPSWGEHLQGGPDLGPYVRAWFDMERSGAGLAWDYFNSPLPRPDFVNYLEDRDLWRKALSYGDQFTIALRSYPQDFAVWDVLARDHERLIDEGNAIQRYYRLRVEELKRHSYDAIIGGFPCRISNAPYFAASEVAGELAAEHPHLAFGACYYEVSPGRYAYSLRSRGEFDVSHVARGFGGGGHKAAAGFATNGAIHHSMSGAFPGGLRESKVLP